MSFADIEGDVEEGRDADKGTATGSGGLASDLQDNSSKKKQVSEDETAGPPHAGEESKKLKHGTSVDNLSLCCSLLCATYICFSDIKPHEMCFIGLEIKHL